MQTITEKGMSKLRVIRLLLIGLTMIITCSITSQNINDSLRELKIAQIINDNETCDSIRLVQDDIIKNDKSVISKQDSTIKQAEGEIRGYKRIDHNNTLTITELRKQVAELTDSGLRWYVYAGASAIIYLLGILTVVIK